MNDKFKQPPVYTIQHDLLTINNLRYLNWEHSVQFLNPLRNAPLFQQDAIAKDFPTKENVIAELDITLARMQERQKSAPKIRVIGPLLSIFDLEQRALVDDRRTTEAAWRLHLRDIMILEYEYSVAGLSSDCWLPKPPGGLSVNNEGILLPQVEPFELFAEIERKVNWMRKIPGHRNKRDQVAEASIVINRYKRILEGKNEHQE